MLAAVGVGRTTVLVAVYPDIEYATGQADCGKHHGNTGNLMFDHVCRMDRYDGDSIPTSNDERGAIVTASVPSAGPRS